MTSINRIPLTAPEISGLWNAYMSETLSNCVLTYFLNKVEDNETRMLLKETLDKSRSHIPIITSFFNEAGVPVPRGYTDKDVNESAPRLFTDTFYLAYLSFMARVGMHNYTMILNQAARADIIDYFTQRTAESMELYKKSADLRLSKGIFIRAPRVEVPKKVEFVKSKEFALNFFGEKRPLLLREVTQIFSMILSNIVGRAIVTAFGQVCKSKEVSEYFFEGKDRATKKINELISIYSDEDIPIPSFYDSFVTDSTESPFSDKLMMSHVIVLISTSISNSGMAMGDNARADLQALYMKYIASDMKYAHRGVNIMIDNEWMEQPLLAIRHEDLVMH